VFGRFFRSTPCPRKKFAHLCRAPAPKSAAANRSAPELAAIHHVDVPIVISPQPSHSRISRNAEEPAKLKITGPEGRSMDWRTKTAETPSQQTFELPPNAFYPGTDGG
jgi:hypothetical protein